MADAPVLTSASGLGAVEHQHDALQVLREIRITAEDIVLGTAGLILDIG
jgi:hypothetical protein